MNGASPDLSQLSAAQWRCLRVLGEFSDLAHAARKLHWSQAVLSAVVLELQESLGTLHIQVLAGRVQISRPLNAGIAGFPRRTPLRPGRKMSERTAAGRPVN